MRARRAAAWLIDVVPLWGAILLVGPVAFIHGLALREEASAGIGLFDPSTAEAIGRRGFEWMARAGSGALLLVFGWAVVQLTALATARRTVGKSLLGLGLRLQLAPAADPPSRGRVLAREMTRFVLLAALPVAYAFYAHPRLAGPVWKRYAPGEPLIDPASIRRTVIVVGGLMIVAILLTLWEAILVAGDPVARTLGDRVARTRVVRRET
jgi:hypothetical protein